MKTIKIFTIILTFLLGISTMGYAGEKADNDGVASTVKEMFLKGSIDGETFFMVLGFEDASKFAKDSLKEAVDIRYLRESVDDLASGARGFANSIYNSEHSGDIYDNVSQVMKELPEAAKEIINLPMKSLEKIPGAYRVAFENARESYYETNNEMLGAVKYSGHAVWANVKGAYYLVVEAPMVMAAALAYTTLAVPGAAILTATGGAFEIMWGAGKGLVKLPFKLAKAAFCTAASFASLSYSLISTGALITASAVTSAGVATFNGAKWVVTVPFRLFDALRVKKLTDIDHDRIYELGEKLRDSAGNDTLLNLGLDARKTKAKISEYKARITLYSKSGKKAVVAEINSKKKSVLFTVTVKKGYFNKLRKTDDYRNLSKKDLKELLRQEISSMLETIAL